MSVLRREAGDVFVEAVQAVSLMPMVRVRCAWHERVGDDESSTVCDECLDGMIRDRQSALVAEHADPAAPARGIVRGLLLAAALWAIVGLVVAAIVEATV